MASMILSVKCWYASFPLALSSAGVKGMGSPTVTVTGWSLGKRAPMGKASYAPLMRRGRDYAQEKGEVIRDKAKKFHEAGEEYVKEKPTQSVLIAMGVGLLIGMLIRRR